MGEVRNAEEESVPAVDEGIHQMEFADGSPIELQDRSELCFVRIAGRLSPRPYIHGGQADWCEELEELPSFHHPDPLHFEGRQVWKDR